MFSRINTRVIDTLADVLGHEPTLGDLVGLDVPDDQSQVTYGTLALTVAEREYVRRERAAAYELANG
jgi:hypothetical protein